VATLFSTPGTPGDLGHQVTDTWLTTPDTQQLVSLGYTLG